MARNILDTFKYLDKNGLTKLIGLLKFGNKKIWHGSQEEWDLLPAAEKAKYDQAEISGNANEGVTYVADVVEEGNMNPVTSDAVYDALNDVESITPTPVTGGVAGTISWNSFDVKKLGKVVNIIINDMRHSQDVSGPGSIVIATGLPKPVLGRIYLTGLNYGDNDNVASAYIDSNGNFGIDAGFLLATSRFYGSVCYISI